MTNKILGISLLLLASLLLAACGPSESPAAEAPAAAAATTGHDTMAQEADTSDAAMKSGDDTMMDDKPTDDAMMDDKPTDDAMMDDKPTDDAMMDDPMVELPAWFSASLTDVTTGQPFTVAGYQGKVVLVETLAVWCSNCLKQQREVLALHEALGERDDFISVGLDIDLNESADQLRDHAERNGFDWTYAIATPEVARAISDLYGVNFLNPPSTPMLIIDRHGQAHPLPFGIKRAAELQAALEPFLGQK